MSMRQWAVSELLLVTAVLMTANVGHAEVNVDVRAKLGYATGVENVEFTDVMATNGSQNGGANFQIELILSQKVDAGATFVGGVGLFDRTHKGEVSFQSPPGVTDVEYDAVGISGTAGVSYKVSDNFHIEGRGELDIGEGKPTLSTPNVIWHSVQDGPYVAVELLLGGYYTVSYPGLQLGLELGLEAFAGNFQIRSNSGSWIDSYAKGRGGCGNLVIGWRF